MKSLLNDELLNKKRKLYCVKSFAEVQKINFDVVIALCISIYLFNKTTICVTVVSLAKIMFTCVIFVLDNKKSVIKEKFLKN